MPANSEIILSNQAHPGDSSSQTVTGNLFKGDGYYGRSDGLHTVQIDLVDFVGVIEVQATLAIDPAEGDWFTVELSSSTTVAGTVDTTGAVSAGETVVTSSLSYSTATTANNNYNFTGNYVWIRTYVTNWTAGTINSIRLNH